jgi:hypothetical protein
MSNKTFAEKLNTGLESTKKIVENFNKVFCKKNVESNGNNVLCGTKCYLSSAIECDDPKLGNWRQETIDYLHETFGIITYDPSQDEKQNLALEINEALEKEDFNEVERIAKLFTKRDLSEIDRSDFLIACVFKGIASVGVPCEIVHAINLKKPVMIVCPNGKKTTPKWYFGNLHHEYIFGSWQDLYAYLKEVNEHKHKNNHRWWYVYKIV